MTTTYQWTIEALDCVPQEDGKTDVVVTAHWSVLATDGTYKSSACNTQAFTYNPTKEFTPFENLTQEQVVGWVQQSMGVDAVTALQEWLDKQIANQIIPPVVTPPLPWIVPPAPPTPA